MDNSTVNWWYARVGASPRPEAGELVNIGLILGNGGPMDVEATPDLPRLRGLVAPSEMSIYEEVLETLKAKVKEGADLESLRRIYGPQIKISEPRALFEEPKRNVKAMLRRKLLETPTDPEGSSPGPRDEAEEKLEQIVGRVAQLGYEPQEKPTPAKLYGDKWHDVFGTRGPSLAYALRSRTRPEDVLFDGVVIHREDPDYSVTHGQVSRIGRAFWEYREAEERILEATGRSIREVGFIFNGGTGNDEGEDVARAMKYIRHTWQQDLDLIVEADKDQELGDLRAMLATGRWE